MSIPSADEAATQFHEVLLGSEHLTGFLDEFTAAMSARLTHLSADGGKVKCAVTLARAKKPVTVAVSDEATRVLEEVQNRFDDGPCLSAMREHHPVRSGICAPRPGGPTTPPSP